MFKKTKTEVTKYKPAYDRSVSKALRVIERDEKKNKHPAIAQFKNTSAELLCRTTTEVVGLAASGAHITCVAITGIMIGTGTASAIGLLSGCPDIPIKLVGCFGAALMGSLCKNDILQTRRNACNWAKNRLERLKLKA
ncbi:MAG: hypothetical protein PHE27_05560 [Alphaproteobacteria bacterium]|nr:hypothetical protein [Alphaproteobacteria bacterium]